jgi:Response regulators consisting of a CheY-like receiver domain and a winged-helix DNA-binding domain
LCRAFHDACETPILVLTARSQKADKIRCLDYGADDYLTKPFDLENSSPASGLSCGAHGRALKR